MNIKSFASLFALLTFMTALTTACATFQRQDPPKPAVDLHLDRNWRCGNEKDAVVCRPTDMENELIKVIVWTAKVAAPTDSIAAYHETLKQPRKVRFRLKKTMSTSISDETVTINGSPWVDAVQSNSEVYGFNTRYLATVKDGLAVLVTFSARKDIFEDFQKEIRSIVEHIEINPPAQSPKN